MQSMCLMLLKSFEDIPVYGVMENFLAVSEETVRTNFEMYQALDSIEGYLPQAQGPLQ